MELEEELMVVANNLKSLEVSEFMICIHNNNHSFIAHVFYVIL